jgi:hypothetical protein
MELILHIANATFSSLELQTKQSKCLKNTAFKQKTFRIVKEHAIRKVSRDHASSWCTDLMGSSHRADREAGKAVDSKRELSHLGCAMVEPAGIEPATFWLQTRRSPS